MEFSFQDGDPVLPVTIEGKRKAEVSGYLDTGATDMVIPSDLKDQAGLRWLGSTSVLTVGGTVPAEVYHGKVHLREDEIEAGFIVRDLPGKEILLGRELIDEYIVTFNGPEKRVEINLG